MHTDRIVRPLLGLGLLLLLLAPSASAQDVEFTLGPGEEGSHTFDGVGPGKYHCHTHSSMGFPEITVSESDGSAAETHTIRIIDDGSVGAFSPDHITIRSGDTIRWVNEGQYAHEIMIWEPGSESNGHDHGDHPHHDEEAPSVAPMLGFLLIAAVFAVLRRRA